MYKHTLAYYQDKAGSLIPSDTLLKGIANSDWWTTLSDYFDDLIWQYFGEREVFINDKFNMEDEAATISNIKRAFSINLKSKAHKYERLYNIALAEYNPLYNVDATEHTERNLLSTGKGDHTLSGTDTTTTAGSEDFEKQGSEVNTKSGNETDSKAGKETNTRSGSITNAYEGSEANTKTGSTATSHTGSDTQVVANTTFDDSTFRDATKTTTTPGATDTETYNSIADTKTFNNREDNQTFNDVTDELSYSVDREDTHTYNDVTDELSFDKRKDVHTYNDVENSTDYGRKDTETRDFNDNEITDHRRFGNIGVTKSQDLALSEEELWRDHMDWMKFIVRECVNCVSYALY